MSGYLDDPEANRVAFRDGWFRSGDIGHFDLDAQNTPALAAQLEPFLREKSFSAKP